MKSPTPRSSLYWALGIQLVCLVWVGWVFREAINPDGIAYLRLASYYVHGPEALRVSGYWGPGLIWALAVLLKLGLAPWLAARVAMGAIALLFTGVTHWFLGRVGVPSPSRQWILFAVALSTPLWSIENISPDLLVASAMLGLVGWVTSSMSKPSAPAAIGAGFLGALGYYCKAVAGPFAILVLLVAPWLRAGTIGLRVRYSGLSIGVMVVLMAPWVAVLSLKYGTLTLSTSARIVHATVGPGDLFRYPLGDEFEAPEAGRLTTWEDPSLRPEQYWAPWDSWDSLVHQIGIVVGNVPKMVFVQSTLFGLWPGILVFFLYALWRRIRGAPETVDPRFWALVIAPMLLQAIYLATLLPLSEQRYFFATVPMLAAATTLVPMRRLQWVFGPIALALAISLPNLARWALLPAPEASAYSVAKSVAEEVETAGLSGPVAGSARMRRGRAGLFLAYYLGQPWYGDAPEATVDDHLESGARLFAVHRDSELFEAFRRSSAVAPLSQLPPTRDPTRPPLAVFVRIDQ